nr:MAG TPA: hypothetical protein [Bacteriophage sp.]
MFVICFLLSFPLKTALLNAVFNVPSLRYVTPLANVCCLSLSHF